MNERFGKDFYRKGNSMKRSEPFSEPPDSENCKLLSSSPSRESALIRAPCVLAELWGKSPEILTVQKLDVLQKRGCL